MFVNKIKVLSILSRIKEIRKDLGLSQENMAKMLNISQNAYYKIEKGDTKLTLIRFFQISDILKIEPAELLYGPSQVFKYDPYYTKPKVIWITEGFNRNKWQQ